MTASAQYPVMVVPEAAAANGLLRLAEQGARRYGDVFALRIEGSPEIVVLASSEHVGVWQSQTDAFIKDFGRFPSSAALTRLVLGPTLLTARQGPEWTQMRKEITSIMRLSKPWFWEALETATDQLLRDIARNGEKRSFSFLPLALDWAVRSVCQPILGDGVSHAAAVELVETLQSCFLAMVLHEGAGAADYEALPSFQRVKAMISDVLDHAIANAKFSDKTIVSACLAAMPEDTSAEEQKTELASVAVGLLAASLHINALALTWTITSLARRQDLLHSIAVEASDGVHCSQQVTRSPFAFAAVREAQRLYPAVPFIERRLTKAVSCSGYIIPEGTQVLFAAWLIQRDPRYWQDPTAFDPSRFLSNAEQVPHSYFPFGVGPRTCVGMNLMFHQLTYTTRRLVQTFDLNFAADQKPGNLTPVMRVNLEPRGDIQLIARKRST